jgi:lipopolysaccharide export system protein LptA
MRRLGRLIAFLFLVLFLSTGAIYYYQRQMAEASATPPPPPLPEGVAGTADRWQWTHTVDGKPMVEISAREYRMIQNPARVELTDVELKIFGGDTTAYDLVKSKRADVDTRAKTMYSEGEVEITMRVPNDGRPMPERPMKIRSSKVHFETESGRAKTAEKTYFQFAEGSGECVGAMYDPQAKEVTLESEARITLQKEGAATATPTKVWAAHAIYREVYAKIELRGPTRMERRNLAMDAGDATIELKDGEIHRVEARSVAGVDRYPKRDLAFGADFAEMKYREDGSLAEIYGDGNARLDATTPSSRSEVRSAKMNLYFREGVADPELEKSYAHGGATLRSFPLGKAAATQPRRVLVSEVIEVQMRPGGAEAERLLTHSEGTLTFLPATPEQRERKLLAERMIGTYGPENALERFEATRARTESKPSAAAVSKARQQKQPEPPVLVTTSQTLEARFQPETGDILWMKQSGNFEFTEGVRRGKANEATLHQADKYNLLEGKAQLWDATGSLSADRIRTVEPSGDLFAEGNVVSTRKPEKKSATRKSDDLHLPGGEETMQATAAKMTTRNNNQWIRYEGAAKLWQGANRLHADVAIIDREAKVLEGMGSVFSQIEEQKTASTEAKPVAEKSAAPAGPAKVYTLIHAAKMRYTDTDKIAWYEGKVRMRRAALSVDSETMRMHLKENDAGNTELEKAFADGNARIRIEEPGNLRRGGGEHAEYYPPDEKMVLYGGEPFFEDQKEGATRGRRLTYYSQQDRLIVESADRAPSVSVIRRK